MADRTKTAAGQTVAVLAGSLAVSLFFAAAPASGFGQQLPPAQLAGDSSTGRVKIPPQAAIAACEGKNEGDGCDFINRKGAHLTGECHSGKEQVFACRPHRPDTATEVRQAPVTGDRESSAPEPAGTDPSLPNRDGIAVKPEKPELKNRPGEKTSAGRTAPVSHHSQPSDSPAAGATAIPQTAPAVPPAESAVTPPATTWLFPVTALLTGLLTWYAFHRYVIIPLRRLRRVTQQLAGGNLSARIGEGLISRRDEVADLARDVDRMADRIEGLVSSHQRLIRDVSHELRSPLARLNVALELARNSADDEHQAPFDRIERETERLNELIGQLLMLTRLEGDSGMGTRTEVDLAELVQNIGHDADFEARSDNRRVMVTTPETLVISGNRELLRQALENLVRNAVRHTPSGTTVEMTLRRQESNDRRSATITVLDHGPGVPESELANIFRPFYRVGDARERQSGGYGVGLAISDRAVKLHGGSIRAYNEPGAGLAMAVEFPLL